MNFEVRTDSLPGTATALASARGHTVVIDRPADAGGQEIPNSLRRGTSVRLSGARVHGAEADPAASSGGG